VGYAVYSDGQIAKLAFASFSPASHTSQFYHPTLDFPAVAGLQHVAVILLSLLH